MIEYINTQQDLTDGRSLHHQTLDMRGFWPVEFLLLNNHEEYVLTFNILAQVLVDSIAKCAN
jgi:hypothetical protein